MTKKTLLAFLALYALAACGIKPGYVDPPNGPDSSNFPRTYPDVSTDP